MQYPTKPLAQSVIWVEATSLLENGMNLSEDLDFAAWLKQHHACEEMLAWAADKTLRAVWDTCERGDWLEWLLCACGYQWKATAWAEYERVTATAWAEYKRVKAPAWAEYKRVTAPAWAEYKRVTPPPAWAEYERVTAPAWAEYKRVTADTIRMLVPYPFSAISH